MKLSALRILHGRYLAEISLEASKNSRRGIEYDVSEKKCHNLLSVDTQMQKKMFNGQQIIAKRL